MNTTALIIIVSAIALGIVFGAARLLDKRGKTSISEPQVPLGPAGRLLKWVANAFVALAILAIIGAFVFRDLIYTRIAWNSIILYILFGILFYILRRTGK